MSGLLEFFIFPHKAVYGISRKNTAAGAGLGILVLSAVSLVSGMSLIVTARAGLASYSSAAMLMICALFVLSVIYHYFAGIMGGVGSGGRLFSIMLYSLAPFCFIAPFSLVFKVFLGKSALIAAGILILLVFYYTLSIQHRIVSYYYGLPASSSLIVILMPWLVISVMAAVSATVAGLGILSIFI
ncbi:MAG: hypothetical protein JXJ19_02525 [Elusimicrobia bacterium]|nr:hypothetical protein [Elusimicrobiota bacterium]